MSFGLGHGRTLDDAPGAVGISPAELPPLPDDLMARPEGGRVDPRAWFPDPSRPFEIEIGVGKGSFLLQHAATNPAVNILGIERAHEFYLYAADRVRRRILPNARMLHTDGSEFLHWRVPCRVVSVIHLYYSDPWPKTRHHKNRVIQHRFLAAAWRCLVPGGELRVVTDHAELWAWCEEHFALWTGPAPAPGRPADAPTPAFAREAFIAPEWVEEGGAVGTNYERKMSQGRQPFAATLRTLV